MVDKEEKKKNKERNKGTIFKLGIFHGRSRSIVNKWKNTSSSQW